MPFARPDPSSPASIADAGFSTGRRGFDQTEVRDFLRMIAAELGRLQERERFLERELRTAQSNPDLASVQLDDAALTRLLGEETARVLTTARESAVEIRQKAEEAAAQLLGEASDEATRMREEAEIEASRRRSDAAADAEAELAMAKQQGREMVNEARAYRERVLSELARRRELAREQIEQLLHGRDRLMQSFERARLVAIDVVAELQPLGEPDEYVNLSPTTGPVPVMVPNGPRPSADRAEPGPGAEPEEHTTPSVSSDDAGPAGDDSDDELDVNSAVVAEVEQPVVDDEVVDDSAPVDDAAPVDDSASVDDYSVDVEPAVDDTESPIDDAESEADADDVADPRGDDVVVDLFSRLRAESISIVDGSPDGHDDAADDDVGAAAAAPDSTEPIVSPREVSVVETDEAATDPGGDEPTPFERRDADLTPIIVAAAKKLKRVLADEQNEVLEALRRNEPVRALDAVLPSAGEHAARYQAAIVDDELLAATAGASMASGGPATLRKADATGATQAAGDVLAEWLVVPLRERLDRCVNDGDGDNVGIGKRVRAVYREWKTQHIDEQLDDVIRMAHGRGVLAAIKRGTPVIWACDAAQQSCSDCDDNTLAGAVAAGDEFPTGHTFAPAHMGCRCLLLPEGS